VVAVAFLTIGTMLVVWTRPAAAQPTRPIDRDIESYVLFALTSLHFGAGNTLVSQITGGNIGVNSAGGEISTCGGGGNGQALHMDDGSQVVADNVSMQANCDIWDLFTNNLTGGSPPTIRNAGPEPIDSFPIITTLPAFPDFSCPNTDQQVLSGVLPPGGYGHVVVDGSLTLGAGTYTFCSLRLGGGQLITDPGTVVQIVSRLVAGNDAIIGPACNALFYIKNENVGGDSNFDLSSYGRRSTIAGRFWAPNGTINLGNTTNLNGEFWADELIADFNVNVAGCTDQGEPTTTTTTTATTTPSSTTTTAPGSTTTGSLGVLAESTQAASRRQLARTGTTDGRYVVLGFACIMAGLALLATERRLSRDAS
jgi:hypothetical protein